MGDENELAEQLKRELKAEVDASREAYEAQRARRETAQEQLDKLESDLYHTKSRRDTDRRKLEEAKKKDADYWKSFYAAGKNAYVNPEYRDKAVAMVREQPWMKELTTQIENLTDSVRSLTAAVTALESNCDEVRSELRDAETQERETKAIYDETQTEYKKVVERDFSERLWQGQTERFDPFKRASSDAALERYDPASSDAVLERFDPDASDHAALERYDPDKPRRVSRTRRVATIAVGATIAIGATVVGASLLDGGDGSLNGEAPAVVEPSGDQSDAGQSGSSGTPSDAGGVEDQGSNDSIGDAGSSSARPLELVEIGRLALKGTGRTLPDGQAFDAFFQLLFVPNDAISTIDRLYEEEDYLDSAAEELIAATGGKKVAEVEVTQFFADPATGAPGQDSFGVVVQLDPSTFMIGAFGTDGSTFSEANAFVLTCEGFTDCVGSELRGANLGGPFGLDPRQAIGDAIDTLQAGSTQIPDGYGWAIDISGSITGVDSPQSVVDSQTFPIDSGTFEGRAWFKWKLDEPVSDQVEQHVTFQLNISSVEDGLWGAGYTFPVNEAPFATAFCLEDRPDCDNGEVPVEGELNSEGDEITWWIAEGVFGDATGLGIHAFVQTYATPLASPVTESIADGAAIPVGTDERDPC